MTVVAGRDDAACSIDAPLTRAGRDPNSCRSWERSSWEGACAVGGLAAEGPGMPAAVVVAVVVGVEVGEAVSSAAAVTAEAVGLAAALGWHGAAQSSLAGAELAIATSCAGEACVSSAAGSLGGSLGGGGGGGSSRAYRCVVPPSASVAHPATALSARRARRGCNSCNVVPLKPAPRGGRTGGLVAPKQVRQCGDERYEVRACPREQRAHAMPPALGEAPVRRCRRRPKRRR